jgi:hypothetical protein
VRADQVGPISTTRESRLVQRTHEQTQFVPVTMSHAAPRALAGAQSRSIEVELHRGALTMKLTWPAAASLELAAWMRELLR